MNRVESTTIVRKKVNMEKMNKFMKTCILCLLGYMIGRGVIETMSPMLIAYLGGIYEHKKIRIWAFMAGILGLISTQTPRNMIKYLIIVTSIYAIGTVLELIIHKQNRQLFSLIGGVCTFLTGIGMNALFKEEFYPIGGLLIEGLAVFFLMMLFKKGIYELINFNEVKASKETYISFSLLACAATIGILGITIVQMPLFIVIALNLLLYMGYIYGLEASSIMGVAIGFGAMYTGGEGVPGAFIQWSILGIIAALFRDLGKIGTALAYGMTFITLVIVYNPAGLELIILQILVATLGIFLIIPVSMVGKKEKTIAEAIHEDYLEETIKYRLEKLAKSYESLAKKFVHSKPEQEQLTVNEVNELIDMVAERVCKDCDLCTNCWQKDFYDTYKTVYSILSAVESKGEVSVEDLPREFYNNCLRSDEFMVMVNRIFEMYKNNLRWENKLSQHKNIFANQFSHIASMIDDISKQVTRNRQEQRIFIKRIREELDHMNLDVTSLYLEQCSEERDEVIIEIRKQKDMGIVKELLKNINKWSERKYALKQIDDTSEIGIKRITLCVKETYRLVKGFASMNKNEQKVSGDCFAFIDLESGKDIIALSDGMGSGEKAFLESKMTIEMLEQLLEGGFEIENAIKTVNTVLGIRNDQKAFATLDISMMDRYTGECSFIKSGAVSTYLKRGQHIEKIKTDTLPLGMFMEIEATHIKKKLKGDDLIIMMSDGINDLGAGEDQEAQWLEELIADMDCVNPQKIADQILEYAKEKSRGNVKDDMTVLAFRVWERTGI